MDSRLPVINITLGFSILVPTNRGYLEYGVDETLIIGDRSA